MHYIKRPLTTVEANEIMVLLELAGSKLATFGRRSTYEDSIIQHYSWNNKFYEVKRHYNSRLAPTVTEIITAEDD